MKTLKRCVAALLLVMALMASAFCALAENLPEPFIGYFDKVVYIREKPVGGSNSKTHIPENTAVEMTPVNEFYASVTYKNVSGYVYYPDALPMPEEEPVENLIVYLTQNKYLYDTPLGGAGVVSVMQAETPMTVVASVGKYYHVKAGKWDGYVYQQDCTKLTAFDSEPAQDEFYVASQASLRAYPLANAEAVAKLESGRIYQAEAISRGFYRVTVDGVSGWIASRQVSTFTADASTTRVALMKSGVTLYARPDKGFPAEAAYSGGERLMFISKENNGFFKLDEEALYVWPGDVETFAVDRVTMQQLFVGMDVELTLRPSGSGSAKVTLSAGELYAAQYSAGSAYLVYAEDTWGFLPKTSASVSSLEAGERMNRTAALVTTHAVLYGEDGRRTELREGAQIFLTDMGDDFYRCTYGGTTGFVLRQAVRIVGADAPLTAYAVKTPESVLFMTFPDQRATSYYPAIPKGATVQVDAFNRCYLRVTYNGRTGYVKQDGLTTAESEGIPKTEDVPSYQVALDKSNYMAYVFLLDEKGEPCAVVMSAKVGIGKRSTPTPSGTFTLGFKERWHAFTYSYTPHTTTYVRARFIHGIPCNSRDESTMLGYMNRAGSVTGGCLRSPMAFARFIYMNCPSYQTELVIVSGGLEVPERIVTPEELFAGEIATPTDIASPSDL